MEFKIIYYLECYGLEIQLFLKSGFTMCVNLIIYTYSFPGCIYIALESNFIDEYMVCELIQFVSAPVLICHILSITMS